MYKQEHCPLSPVLLRPASAETRLLPGKALSYQKSPLQSAKPTSAFLCAVGQFFHDRLHTVEGGGIGKVHFVSSFS